MDVTKKFDGRAKVYTTGRPSYAEELIDSLYINYGMRACVFSVCTLVPMMTSPRQWH